MKKSIILAAACVIAAGCAKEGFETASRKFVPVTMEIGAPSTKIALDGTTGAQTWIAGDKVAINSYIKDASSVYHNYHSEMTASASGASSSFIGMIDEELFTFTGTYNFVISPYSAVTSYKTNSCYLTIPANQTGKLEDFGKYSISISKRLYLEKQGDGSLAFPSAVGQLYNFTPALKFTIAPGNKVTKIVISGFRNGVQQTLVAQKSNGEAIQAKLGTPQIYVTNSDIQTLTIERAASEEISGDIYAVLAPNFPQTSDKPALKPDWQWEDGKYDYNQTDKIPCNACDSLSFTFYDIYGGEVEFGKKLKGDKVLRSGTIVDLGTITSLPFPAPEIKLAIAGSTGKLGCTPKDETFSYVYEMTTDGTTPADPTVSSQEFPDDSLSFAERGVNYEVRLKVAQVRGGAIVSVKNAFLRKCFPAKQDPIDLKPGESAPLGFMSFNNFWIDPAGKHENEVLGRITPSTNCLYKCYKLDAAGEVTTSTYASKGENHSTDPCKTSLTFNATYPGAECSLYTKGSKSGRRMTLKYEEDKLIKAPHDNTSGAFAVSEVAVWTTSDDFQTTTVNGGGKATVYIFTDYTTFDGFAWLEQGFKSF